MKVGEKAQAEWNAFRLRRAPLGLLFVLQVLRNAMAITAPRATVLKAGRFAQGLARNTTRNVPKLPTGFAARRQAVSSIPLTRHSAYRRDKLSRLTLPCGLVEPDFYL
jgi:hypothetical protein